MIASSVGMTFKMSKAVPAAKRIVEETKIVTKERTVLFENWDACTEDAFLANCSEDCCIYEFNADLGIWECYLSNEGAAPQHFVQTYPGLVSCNIEYGAYGGLFLTNSSARILELTKKIKIRHKCVAPAWCDGDAYASFYNGIPPTWSLVWEAELAKSANVFTLEEFAVGTDLLGHNNLCFSVSITGRRAVHIDYILIT